MLIFSVYLAGERDNMIGVASFII